MTEPDREAKRQQILLAVWSVIADHGIEAVSVRSVAAAAGVSAGRVQHYFPTRGDLVRESAHLMIDQASRQHERRTSSGNPQDELWHLLTHAFAGAAESRAGVAVFYAFLAAGARDPQIAQILGEAKVGATHEAARLLRGLRPDLPDPDRTARQLVALADGLTLQLLLGRATRRRAEQDVREALEHLAGPTA